jgi:predicted kinase/predicted phosphodiesterase
MRVLYLMRGVPGAGKSSFLKERHLEEFTLCPDSLRLLTQSPELKVDGSCNISMNDDKYVWSLLFDLLERRMRDGHLTFIDATHTHPKYFNRYKKLAEQYRYRTYCIDFSHVSLCTAKRQNLGRVPCKQVPESAIDRMYEKIQNSRVPGWITTIKPSQFAKTFNYAPKDISQYDKLVVFGDIHGCYTPLNEYIEKYKLLEGNFYVFLGDYIDRGLEDDKVIELLMEIASNYNVVLLEGNHEKWLIEYAFERYDNIRSNEFKNHTQAKLERFDKKDLRALCRRLSQLAYLKFGDNYFLCTHGGLSTAVYNLLEISTKQIIKGVGKYEDYEKCAENWDENSLPDHWQIFGHRNVYNKPAQLSKRSFCLEDSIEFGGNLRILEITK